MKERCLIINHRNIIIIHLFLLFILVQLLSEEYRIMSPKSMEEKGLINTTEYQKTYELTQSVSSDAHKKISGFYFYKVLCYYQLTI